MTESTRQKKDRARLVGLIAAWALIGLIAAGPTPCPGMDAMTMDELGSQSGQTGLTVVFVSGFTVQAEFTALCHGDGDGWGGTLTQDRNAGWLVLTGTGVNTGRLSVSVPDETECNINVATTDAGGYVPGAPYNGIAIPGGTPFVTFSLSNTTITLLPPTTVNIALSANSATAYSNDLMGKMEAENVTVGKKPNTESTLYFWAH